MVYFSRNMDKSCNILKKYSKNLLAILILLALTAWAGKGLFKYPIYQTHDLDHHLVRSLDALYTLKEGHFPLRWAGLLNFGCGTPIYNFFNPLFYYLSPILIVVLGNIMDSIRIINLLSLFFGSLFIYLWLKNETSNLPASLVAALLYLYAPYRFVLIYVRGSPEYLAYAILPAVFYFYSLAFKKERPFNYLLLASLFGGLSSISHNVVFLLSTPVIAIYLLLKVLENKKTAIKNFSLILFSFISIFGLGAFFIIPAFLEQQFTQIGTPAFWYKDHFPILKQLISSPWGYGDSASSVIMDAMSFRLGVTHWAVLLLTFIFIGYKLFRSRLNMSSKFILNNLWLSVFGTLALIFIFLDLPVSNFFWEKATILQAIQFPWRILGITVFITSALAAFLLSKIRSKWLYLSLLIIIPLLALFENRNHLLPQPVHEDRLSFYENISSLKFEKHSVTQVQDKVLASGNLSQCSPETPIATSKQNIPIKAEEIDRKSTQGQLRLDFDKDNFVGEKIILNLDYFPNIFVFDLNGKLVNYYDCEGRACLPATIFKNGLNTIKWKVVQSPTQRISNVISLLFATSWFSIVACKFVRRKPESSTRKSLESDKPKSLPK